MTKTETLFLTPLWNGQGNYENGEWRDGTSRLDALNAEPFGFSIYAKPFLKRVIKYGNGETKVEYGRLNTEKGTYAHWLNCVTSISYNRHKQVMEVECNECTSKLFVDMIKSICNISELAKSFKLVVFDPPHLVKVGENSWLAKKYGKLSEDWPRLLKQGINECFRVLDDYGVLVFKWNEDQVTVKEVLRAIDRQPLFGHTTGRSGKTMWMCFMKLPNN